MAEVPVPPLRKADFWSSLVLIVVSALMLIKALGFPLQGTYAGVRNAWYVSPALLPLIISAILILLASSLMIRSIRVGGAAAALADLRRPTGALVRAHAAFWVVGATLGAYVYGFIPHVDFVAATALFLLCFTTGFHLADARIGRTLIAALIAGGALLFAGGLAGLVPGPRTAAAYTLDGVVWAAVLLALGLLVFATAGAGDLRRRSWQCVGTSLGTAFLLSLVFKYGLLVPLPREGLTVALLDPVFYALRAAF